MNTPKMDLTDHETIGKELHSARESVKKVSSILAKYGHPGKDFSHTFQVCDVLSTVRYWMHNDMDRDYPDTDYYWSFYHPQ